MFNENRRYSVTGRNALRSTPVQQRATSHAVLSTRSKEEAFVFGGSALGGGFNSGSTSLQVSTGGMSQQVGLLTGLVPQNEQSLRQLYRDIYYYDAVGGSAADMLSTFPYSDFTLTGVDQDRIDKYTESMVRLNIRQLMPSVTLGYLVDGEYCSSLIFHQKEKVFIDMINYPIDDCTVEHTALQGLDPIITVKTSEMLRRFITSDNRQAKSLRSVLPRSLLQVLQEPAFELDPLTALYIARRTIPGSVPISWLKRMLPIYLIERTLYRSTLVEAQRRVRAMLHVAMGDDTHEFTPEEMAETVNQFQLADQDPLGAVVGTRNNVTATEVRSGGDFWKWTDQIDTLTPYKLRALGISEAFLSGDSTYSNVESGMSVFMENTDTLRSNITYETLTNKIFPIIAVSNDFFKPGKEVNTESRNRLQFQLSNHNDLDIPTVRWHKSLEVKPEENMMELLGSLSEKGFPIPLRMWAAAAKVDLNSLYQDLEQDKIIKKKLAALTGIKADAIGVAPPEEDDEGGGSFGGSDDGFGDESGDGGSEEAKVLSRLTQAGMIRKVPLLARKFNSDNEVRGKTKTGKDKAIVGRMQKQHEQRLNEMIAKSVMRMQDPNVRRAALQRARRANGGRLPKLI